MPSEAYVRGKARRRGFRVCKSRERTLHLNNKGLFQLANDRNEVVLGIDYDATLEDIKAYLHENRPKREGPWAGASARLANCMHHWGIDSPEQARGLTDAMLLRIDNLGRRTLAELRALSGPYTAVDEKQQQEQLAKATTHFTTALEKLYSRTESHQTRH